MLKKIGFIALGALMGSAAAATAVVWDGVDGAIPDKDPAYFYTFKYGTGASIDTTNVNGMKVLDFDVPAGKSSAGAGYGFGWKQNADYDDVAISLSSYKGACITYTAEYPFRVDFKQSNIGDDNYYGMDLPAAANYKSTFVAFADLKQGWKSDATVAWNVGKQMGVQFSYKNTHAQSSNSNTNAVVISKFILADECVTYAPVLKYPFTDYNGGGLNIDEGATHEIVMSDVFEDPDGDDLSITVKIESTGSSVVLVDSTAYDLKSTIVFTTVANPTSDAKVTINATDTNKKSATFTFTFYTKDVENAPVAKDFAIELPEDSSYKSPLSKRLSAYGFDADGDEIAVEIVTEPEHGSFELNSNGVFTYIPKADFNGTDSFTYKFVETSTEAKLESNIGTCTITVTPVNDAPVVVFEGDTFEDADGTTYNYGDTLVVDEDFASFSILVPVTNVSVTDVDGADDIVIGAKASGIVATDFAADAAAYTIEISAIRDANGIAKISLVAGDHKITKSTMICYVQVNSVIDPPTPKDDEYTIPQDSLFKVSAKNGVLANDLNPDSVKVAAVLDAEAEHGTVTLAEDGSFTYESEPGYEGKDYFGYVIKYDGGVTQMGVVTVNVVYKNKAPTIVEGVLDTVGTRLAKLTEDFTAVKKYTKAEVQSWFVDDQNTAAELTYTVRSDDSLLAPSIASGVISIKAVKDACGEAEVIVTAKDKDGATTDLRIPASISCVNDKPVVSSGDTIYIASDSAFVVKVGLWDYVSDPDGDSLTFTPNSNTRFDVAVEDDSLVVSAIERVKYTEGQSTAISVKVSDGATYATLVIIFKIGPDPAAIKPVIAAPKSTWQNAILASHGTAALFNVQGRLMWTAKLPVSEGEVRAAAAKVQGRKILQVNKQVWTIR